MENACYRIEKYQDQWVVSACGTRIMICKKKRTALKTVKHATVLLHGEQAASFGEETICREHAGDRAPPPLALFYALPACWFAGIALASFEAVSNDWVATVPRARTAISGLPEIGLQDGPAPKR
jgi:hypothetical protein